MYLPELKEMFPLFEECCSSRAAWNPELDLEELPSGEQARCTTVCGSRREFLMGTIGHSGSSRIFACFAVDQPRYRMDGAV